MKKEDRIPRKRPAPTKPPPSDARLTCGLCKAEALPMKFELSGRPRLGIIGGKVRRKEYGCWETGQAVTATDRLAAVGLIGVGRIFICR